GGAPGLGGGQGRPAGAPEGPGPALRQDEAPAGGRGVAGRVLGDRPLDVLRRAVVVLDPPADPRQGRDLGVGQAGLLAQRPGHVGGGHPQPPGSRRCSRSLGATTRLTISPVTLLITNRSGVTSPLTSAEPRPQQASTLTPERSPVVGLQVNMPPAQRGSTMRWTTTAIARPCSPIFIRRR